MLDCYFTGVSAMALITAVRREWVWRWRNKNDKHHSTDDDDDDDEAAAAAGISVVQEWALWNLPGTLAVLAFVLFGHTLPLEQWYIGPVLLALISMVWWRLWLLFHRDKNRSSSSSIGHHGAMSDEGAETRLTILMVVAVIVGVGGMLGDAPTCRWGWQGGWFLDFFTFGNALFAACNVAFGAIFDRAWKHLQARQQQQQQQSMEPGKDKKEQ
jgi:hypothetical protein